MKKFKSVLKKTLPSYLLRKVSGLLYGWHGNYASWDEAKTKCTGYDSDIILEKVKSSVLQVKNGIFPYERDSALFDEIQYSYPVLAGLMWISAMNNGKLHLLDFGGSLGSSYFQNKHFLDSLPDVKWCIVEQPGFVRTGKEFFENNHLMFFDSIEECLSSYNCNVILLSSVIQYLEEPYNFLKKIFSLNIEYIIIDRTPFINGKDRITIQKVNPGIYPASYPCWFFNKCNFNNLITERYKIIAEFESIDKSNINSEFLGFILRNKGQ
jgi:putative methyltransferase (TIGR04325 family)